MPEPTVYRERHGEVLPACKACMYCKLQKQPADAAAICETPALIIYRDPHQDTCAKRHCCSLKRGQAGCCKARLEPRRMLRAALHGLMQAK